MAGEITARQSKNSLLTIVAVVFAIVAAGGAGVVYLMSDWNAPTRVRDMPNPVAVTPENLALGQAVYRQNCAKCHGDAGDGKGEKAGDLSVMPTDFTNAHEMKGLKDGELFWRISVGHRPMPSYKSKLSEEERWEVVDFIRTFSK